MGSIASKNKPMHTIKIQWDTPEPVEDFALAYLGGADEAAYDLAVEMFEYIATLLVAE